MNKPLINIIFALFLLAAYIPIVMFTDWSFIIRLGVAAVQAVIFFIIVEIVTKNRKSRTTEPS